MALYFAGQDEESVLVGVFENEAPPLDESVTFDSAGNYASQEGESEFDALQMNPWAISFRDRVRNAIETGNPWRALELIQSSLERNENPLQYADFREFMIETYDRLVAKGYEEAIPAFKSMLESLNLEVNPTIDNDVIEIAGWPTHFIFDPELLDDDELERLGLSRHPKPSPFGMAA